VSSAGLHHEESTGGCYWGTAGFVASATVSRHVGDG
jgi:hypothetical protein